MKFYSFAPISACEFPTVRLLDHPHIWGGVQFSLNVSEKEYSPELKAAMASHGIDWAWCKVSEDDGAQWWDSLYCGMILLDEAYKAGKKIVVHCDWGNNRSRTFVEAFYHMNTGKQLEDEYKGEINHLVYNTKIGHLPPMEDLDSKLRDLWFKLNNEKVKALFLEKLREDIETFHCGTPYVRALNRAVDDYKNGRPVGERIISDEVSMTIYDEWKSVVSERDQEGNLIKIYAPYYSIDGIDEKWHLNEPDSIVGFLPERGHIYRLKVKRICLKRMPELYRYYELIQVLSDKTV